MKMKTNLLKNSANEWLLSEKYLLKESTYHIYYKIIRNHIIPLLGNKKINQITKKDIMDFNNKLCDYGNRKNGRGLNNKTVRDINSVLHLILKYEGIELQVKLPKIIKKEIDVIPFKELSILENYCINNLNSYTLGIIIAINTGIRLGELCALKWENIDLINGIIYINSTLQRIPSFNGNKSKVIITSPKTCNSIREIPINNNLLKCLKKVKKNKDCFVLTNAIKPIEERGYYRRYKTILKHAKLKDYNFHVLRHTFATRCASVGIDAKSLSEVLGHSNVKTTLTLYVHPSLSIKRDYLNLLCK